MKCSVILPITHGITANILHIASAVPDYNFRRTKHLIRLKGPLIYLFALLSQNIPTSKPERILYIFTAVHIIFASGYKSGDADTSSGLKKLSHLLYVI